MKKLLLLLYIIISIHTSAQWQNLGSASFSAGQVQYTSIAVWGATPFVAYRDLANSNKCSVMKYDGATWVQVGSSGFSASGALYTSIAIDNGFPFVAYVDGSASNRVTVKAFDGSSWITIGTAGFTGDNTSYVNLIFDGSVPYVAYQDGSNSNKLSVMKFDGSNWVQVGIAGFSAGTASEISLAMLGGTPYVSFKDNNATDKLSVMYFDGSNWQYLGSQGFTPNVVGQTSIAHDGTSIFVAYVDGSTSDKLSVMKFSGSWTQVGSAGFSNGSADYIDLTFNGSDPYIAYQDQSYGFRANVMWFDGTDWLEVGVPGFTPSQAIYCSLAFIGGNPVVAFQDYAGGTYKASVMKYEPCFDADIPTLTLSETTICKNMPLTLTIASGNLNSADYWSVYTGSCGGTLLGTFSGTSAVLIPLGNTTYYVRGEPACISPLPCASVAVSVIPIDSSVTISGGTMTAVSSGASYQWLDCNDGFTTIPGEINQSFSPTTNGSYALKISENGCVDSSACYIFNSVEIAENAHMFELIQTNEFIEIATDISTDPSQIRLTDMTGKNTYVQVEFSHDGKFRMYTSNLMPGCYLLFFGDHHDYHITRKIIIY